MLRNIKSLHFLVAILVAVFTTGWMRVHLIPWGPEPDGAHYTFLSQYIYYLLSTGQSISELPLSLYSTLTAWVYALDINQFMALSWIDLCMAVIASILFFSVIKKESTSLSFTFIVLTASLLIMNHQSVIFVGFNNSIWAAYVPFFSALLISQNLKQDSNYGFYFIGALASFGVLLREPLLSFYIVGTVAIFFAFGWRPLLKYLIGSAILGFSTIILLRGWDLFGLLDAYAYVGKIISDYGSWMPQNFSVDGLFMMKQFWFGLILFFSLTAYLLKIHLSGKDQINLGRCLFWLAIALVPIIEAWNKWAEPYHFAQCIPGLIGFSALGWKYLSLNESKKIRQYSIIAIYLVCLVGVQPQLNLLYANFKDERTLANAYNQLWTFPWRQNEVIRGSNYLISAETIRHISNEDSTLSTSGFGTALYPLSGLLPPIYKFHDLRSLYSSLDYDEDKLIAMIREHQPTIIMPTNHSIPRIKELTKIIQRTGLYEKVAYVANDTRVAYSLISGNIYRLKSFVKKDN